MRIDSLNMPDHAIDVICLLKQRTCLRPPGNDAAKAGETKPGVSDVTNGDCGRVAEGAVPYFHDKDVAAHRNSRQAEQHKPAETQKPCEAIWKTRVVLEIDENRRGVVLLHNRPVLLTKTEFRVLLVLARQPNMLVDYREIHDTVWLEQQVSRQQVSNHMRAVLKKFGELIGMKESDALVTVNSGNGLRLNMRPDQVIVRPMRTGSKG